MRIAYIHFHLKTGGVTTVIRQQIEACAEDCEVLVLTGLAPDAPFIAPVEVIEGLGYDVFTTRRPDPSAVATEIMDTIRSHFGCPCDLVHVHNPTLAKNQQLLKILKILQSQGVTLLLQIHDFAEDGRPLAYFSEQYPADCHYAVINSRDHQLLCQAGGTSAGVHQLTNTVSLPGKKPSIGTPGPRILYPVRAIRRKNIGEAILLSLFFKTEEYLAITLPPNSPMDVKSYNGWKSFVADRQLAVEFDAGNHRDFSALVNSSRYLVTTSITEGFGFSFLEPWLYFKMIRGRKLPDICADFENSGINLTHLYPQLQIPLDWIDAQRFYDTWSGSVLDNCHRFNYPIETGHIEASFDKLSDARRRIDFGLLSEPFQKTVIDHLLTAVDARKEIATINTCLGHPDSITASTELITSNRQAILSAYNQQQYRQHLLDIYAEIIRHPVRQRIDKRVLLDYFLRLENFSLLKWSPYVE